MSVTHRDTELKVDRPWSEYPTGTKAPAIMGGWWYKVKLGWKWNGPQGSGGVFPTPGYDAKGVVILPQRYVIMTLEDATSLAKSADGRSEPVAQAVVDRILADKGAPIQDIVDDLRGLGACAACSHEGLASSCVVIEAQRCGRRLRRLLEIARGERKPWLLKRTKDKP